MSDENDHCVQGEGGHRQCFHNPDIEPRKWCDWCQEQVESQARLVAGIPSYINNPNVAWLLHERKLLKSRLEHKDRVIKAIRILFESYGEFESGLESEPESDDKEDVEQPTTSGEMPCAFGNEKRCYLVSSSGPEQWCNECLLYLIEVSKSKDARRERGRVVISTLSQLATSESTLRYILDKRREERAVIDRSLQAQGYCTRVDSVGMCYEQDEDRAQDWCEACRREVLARAHYARSYPTGVEGEDWIRLELRLRRVLGA